MMPNSGRPEIYNPYWFRRAIHVFPSFVLVYYFFWTDSIYLPIKQGLFLAAVAWMVCWEVGRLRGKHVPPEGFLGLDALRDSLLRDYEQDHCAGYIGFGIAAIVLLLAFPPVIAAPCILAAAIGDPLMGELRRWGKGKTVPIALLFCMSIFVVFGYKWWLALLAGGIMVLAESIKFDSINDDFLMPVVPACVLLPLSWAGIVRLPHVVIQHPVERYILASVGVAPSRPYNDALFNWMVCNTKSFFSDLSVIYLFALAIICLGLISMLGVKRPPEKRRVGKAGKKMTWHVLYAIMWVGPLLAAVFIALEGFLLAGLIVVTATSGFNLMAIRPHIGRTLAH